MPISPVGTTMQLLNKSRDRSWSPEGMPANALLNTVSLLKTTDDNFWNSQCAAYMEIADHHA